MSLFSASLSTVVMGLLIATLNSDALYAQTKQKKKSIPVVHLKPYLVHAPSLGKRLKNRGSSNVATVECGPGETVIMCNYDLSKSPQYLGLFKKVEFIGKVEQKTLGFRSKINCFASADHGLAGEGCGYYNCTNYAGDIKMLCEAPSTQSSQ